MAEAGLQPGEAGFDWNAISVSKHLKGYGKSSKQLNERWINYARPGIKREGWSNDEHAALFELADKHERSWMTIAAELGDRSPNDCKNRYHSHKSRPGNDALCARVKAAQRTSSSSALGQPMLDDGEVHDDDGDKYVQCSSCEHWHLWPLDMDLPGDNDVWSCEMQPTSEKCRPQKSVSPKTPCTAKKPAKTSASTAARSRGPGRPPRAPASQPQKPKGPGIQKVIAKAAAAKPRK